MSDTPESKTLSPRLVLILGGTAILVVAVIGVLVAVNPKSGCAGIFEQTAPRLETQLEIIKSKGGFAVGQEKIQELTEGAQKVALHLKTCCTVLDGGALDPAEFQGCIAKASDYERQLVMVAEQVDQAQKAMDSGDQESAQHQVTQIRANVDEAIQEVDRLEQQVKRIDPAKPPSDGSTESERGATASKETEPNNDILESNALALGMPVTAEISAADDNDFYRLEYTGELRDLLSIKLENQSTTLRPWIKVFNANKSQTASHYNGTPGANLEYQIVLEPGAVHHVQVLPYDTAGKYRLTLMPHRAYDRFEPNDSPFDASPISTGQSIEASIMDKGDNDWYKLADAGSDSLRVRLSNQSRTLRPWIKVYDGNKAQLSSNYSGTAGADLEVSIQPEAGETYYLQVLPYDTHGPYRLSIQ